LSEFTSQRASKFIPYVPGERLSDREYIRLNTNESPYPPPQSVIDAAAKAAAGTNLYSDPNLTELKRAIADHIGVSPECVTPTNGSDEAISFVLGAFTDSDGGLAFADLTYGFYKNIASFYNIPYTLIPLDEDLKIRAEDYIGLNKTVIVANPNAPTGLAISNDEIRRICAGNPKNIVIIDEAYAEFTGISAVPLIREFENLVVVTTFSKSRFLAGARLGYSVTNPALAKEIETFRNTCNPYNVNSMTIAMGVAALSEDEYYKTRWSLISETRDYTINALRGLGFTVTQSLGNFVFAGHTKLSPQEIYDKLRENGYLVRKLGGERAASRIRISIGTREHMERVIEIIAEMLK